MQPGFCKEGEPKVNFIWTKTAWFSPRAEQTNATQACHRRNTVTKYLVTVDGGLRAQPQPLFFFAILQQTDSNFNAIIITIGTFWSYMNS